MSWEFNLAESFTLWCIVTNAGCCVTALAAPGKTPTAAQKELRLIQSKSDIENPRIIVKAVPLIGRMFATCDNTHSLYKTQSQTFIHRDFVETMLIFVMKPCDVVSEFITFSRLFSVSSSVFSSGSAFLPSVRWHCWLGHLTRKNPSPIWPIMCLVGH